jgi:hypothetical protein
MGRAAKRPLQRTHSSRVPFLNYCNTSGALSTSGPSCRAASITICASDV